MRKVRSLYNHLSALAFPKDDIGVEPPYAYDEDGAWRDYRVPYAKFPDELGAENYYRIYDGQLLWNMTKYLLADNTNGAAVWSLKNLLRGY